MRDRSWALGFSSQYGVFAVFLSLGLLACGSSTSSAKSQTPEDATGAHADAAVDDSEHDVSASDSAHPVELSTDCSDGTCLSCGGGMCPIGAYCDEDAAGGPACAWLAECGEHPSCSCIKKILGSSCACEEANGPSVSCR